MCTAGNGALSVVDHLFNKLDSSSTSSSSSSAEKTEEKAEKSKNKRAKRVKSDTKQQENSDVHYFKPDAVIIPEPLPGRALKPQPCISTLTCSLSLSHTCTNSLVRDHVSRIREREERVTSCTNVSGLLSAQVGVMWLQLRVSGKPAHVLDTSKGFNAIEAALDLWYASM